METQQNEGVKPTKTLLTITQINAMIDNDEIDLEGKGFIITITSGEHSAERRIRTDLSSLDGGIKLIMHLMRKGASKGIASACEIFEKLGVLSESMLHENESPTQTNPTPKI